MSRMKAVNHVLLKKTMAAKVAIAVVFSIFMNTANIPLLMAANCSLNAGGVVSHVGDRLGKIYNIVNVPVQIVNDLFGKNINMLSGNEDEKADKTGKMVFGVLIASSKNAKKSAETSLFAVTAWSGGNMNKFNAKSDLLLLETVLQYGRHGPPLFERNNIIWLLLLFLMLMPILPRGIPVRVKNCIVNIKSAYSRLYFR